MSPQDHSQTRRLIELVAEIQLAGPSEARTAELQAMLAGSDALRRLYLDLMSLEGLLGDASLGGASDDAAGDSSEMEALLEAMAEVESAAGEVEPVRLAERPAPTRQPGQPLRLDPARGINRVYVIPRAAIWAGIAAVVLVAGWLGFSLMGTGQGNGPSAPTASSTPVPSQPAALATLTDTRGAVWGGDASRLQIGDGMLPGRYTLERGAAELRMGRGATVLLEAPCRIELLDDNRARLDLGRVVANVPPAATGFTVVAGAVRVVDLGTEFGVQVDDQGRVLTAVFSGEVVLGSADAAVPSVPVKAGQFVQADTAGRIGVAQLSAQPGAGAQAVSLFARSLDAAAQTSPYARAVLADQPLLYWSFEQIEARRVDNVQGTPHFDGLLQGSPTQDAGRVGRGLRFDGSMQPVSGVESFGPMFNGQETEAYTIELWVKAEEVSHAAVAGLFKTAGDQRERNMQMTAIELLGDNAWLPGQPATPNALRFLHRSPVTDSIGDGKNLWLQQTYVPGQWMLLTAVKRAGKIALYRNGELLGEADDDQGIEGPVRLCVGNAGVGAALHRMSVRPFAGVIDEVAVYAHALSPQQIKARYDLGSQDTR